MWYGEGKFGWDWSLIEGVGNIGFRVDRKLRSRQLRGGIDVG